MKHLILCLGIFLPTIASADGTLFHGNCPSLNFSDFQSTVINPENTKPHIKVAWKKTSDKKPYAVVVPSLFQIAAIQIQQNLQTLNLSDYAPDTIELYDLGDSLPAPLANFAAVLCKGLQEQKVMRLIVNESFLTNDLAFKRKLSHELLHYITATLHRAYPTWLEEGLALNFEYYLSGEEDLKLPIYHLQNSPWMPLVPATIITNKQDVLSFYGHAQLFLKYIIHRQGEIVFKHIFEHESSDPKVLFPDLNKLFTDFSIAKYINRIDYMGLSLEEQQKYILIDGIKTNLSSKPTIRGTLSSTTSAGPGEALWIKVGDEIQTSKSPISGAFRISISY